jgi:hypothetical protein
MNAPTIDVNSDLSSAVANLDAALNLGLSGEGRWFRADVCRGIELKEGKPSVDREQGVISGYAVITKGPALGHNMTIDDQTLNQVVELGNKASLGIKSRFDHPSASNTSMGTFLGRTKNFRRAGDRVLGDLHLSASAKEAPQGDLYSYVLGLAERDPQAFGASIVFEGKAEFLLNEDGSKQTDAHGKPLPALARVETLLASDVVDEPAANPGGLFSQGDSLASKVSAFLNRWSTESPILQALQVMTGQFTRMEELMEEQKKELAAGNDDEKKKAFAAGEQAERARVTGIFSAMLPGQEALAKDLVSLGASVEEATKAFKLRKLNELTEAAPKTAGGGEDEPKTSVEESSLSVEDRCKAEWERNADGVRDEFTSLAAYTAFAKADARGAVKILQKS